MYKYSDFNFHDENEDSITIFNSYTCKLYRFKGKGKKDIKEIIEGNINNDDMQFLNYLLKANILVDKNVDETQVMLDRRKDIIDNKDTLFLTILVTMYCNFQCRYCCEDTSENSIMNIDVQNIILEFIEKNVSKYKKLVISWFGGEPMLEIKTIEYMSQKIKEICKKYHVLYIATITTNGYLLDDKMMKRTLKCNIISYCITIDGLPKVHDLQRPLKNGKGTWETIMNNLRRIRDNSSNHLFNIILRTNVTTEFIKDYKEYILFLKSEFEQDLRFHFMWKKAEDWGNIEPEDLYLIEGMDPYYDFLDKKKSLGLRDDLTVATLDIKDRICLTSLKNALVIYPDGRVSKCSRDVKKEITTIGVAKDLIEKPQQLLDIDLIENNLTNCFECNRNKLCFGLTCPIENIECLYDISYFKKMISSIDDKDIAGNIYCG